MVTSTPRARPSAGSSRRARSATGCAGYRDQGKALAQLNLGWCYAAGLGVPLDLVQAAAWYRKAAEQGNAEAINYCDGSGFGRGEKA